MFTNKLLHFDLEKELLLPTFYSVTVCDEMGHRKMNSKKKKPFKCDKCWKVFLTLLALQDISSSIPERNPISAERFKRFPLSRLFENIIKCTENRERPFQCDKFGKVFSYTDSLTRRHKLIHALEQPYKGLTCPKVLLVPVICKTWTNALKIGKGLFNVTSLEKCFLTLIALQEDISSSMP